MPDNLYSFAENLSKDDCYFFKSEGRCWEIKPLCVVGKLLVIAGYSCPGG